MAPTLPPPVPPAAHAPISAAHNRLWLPPLALSGCVRAAMLRSTVGLELNPAQRHTHLPASPLVTLTWWFRGRVDLLAPGHVQTEHEPPASARTPMPGSCTLGGPWTRPAITFAHGPVQGLTLLLQPDAVQRLTGIDPQALVNRVCDAHEVLPPAWRDACRRVHTAADDQSRLACIEAFLLPQWPPSAAVGTTTTAASYGAWMQALVLRAATSRAGRSLRQVERRIKQAAGLPLRKLRGLARAEAVFLHVRMRVAGDSDAAVDWAGVAHDGGYADQSHLCRESRRITGFSPAELRRRIDSDESFWPYRLWE